MKYNSAKIRDYYFLFKKSTKFFYSVLILSALFVVLVAGFFAGFDSQLFQIFSATVFCSMLLQIVTFRRISKPQLDLSEVIFGISNQVSTDKARIPHPEDYGDGFSEVLKFIYSLDSSLEKDDHSKNIQVPNIVTDAPIEFIVLNTQNEVTHTSGTPPTISNIRQDRMNMILAWIEDARKNKIRDFKVWERVSNIFEDPSDQKLYDIAVFFEKQSEDDTVLYFIDKTANYEHDESDLNFIAFAAHEIRGPITIIRGYLDILSMELEAYLSDQQKELFTRLIVSSNKLSGYINNILNVAKFDQNRLEFSPEEYEVSDIFDVINEDITIRASAQNRELEISIPHNLPTIGTDIYGASEVMINLIDNAIKYSNDGGLVKVWAEESDNFVDIYVQDFGIGIPASVLGNLFSKFYRSHRSRETVAGSGIGLYISKAIMEMTGGKIAVKSTEGKGSTFIVSFPIFSKITEGQKIPEIPIAQIKNHGKIF
jgi:two-component system phosphate regulon sensor histidine kinase PhoR/two-component system sensor histidine kinase VicK